MFTGVMDGAAPVGIALTYLACLRIRRIHTTGQLLPLDIHGHLT